jgi:hypothetical protein
VTKYWRGDHIKVEFKDGRSGEAEWLWIEVDHADAEKQLVFGRLDSEPIVNADLELGRELAVSSANILRHRRFRGRPAPVPRQQDGSFNT